MNQPLPIIPESAPFNAEQRAWLNGYLAGLFSSGSAPASGQSPARLDLPPQRSLLIFFGSQTGTAEALAKKIATEAGKHNFAPRVLDMNSFGTVDWKAEQRLLIVTSTWGDGEPPDNAVGFWTLLNSANPPALGHLQFAVLALGDKNYSCFCGAGKNFDARMEQLGAKRIQPRVDCDLDYEAPAKTWIDRLWTMLVETGAGSSTVSTASSTATAVIPVAEPLYSKKNPFPARLLTNRKLNSAQSEKDTRHFEISLKESGLVYDAGDALGVIPRNSPALVEEILTALKLKGEEAVRNGGPSDIPLRQALLEHYEIRQIGPGLLETIAQRAGDSSLCELLRPANKPALDQFLFGREIIDLLINHPEAELEPTEFLSLLRKLTPRLYSISSSPKAYRDEVHLTVAAVRYETHGRKREGVCSTFLADRVTDATPVHVFVQTSHSFRLPSNGDAPVIMVGPGTGIAPFRAFLEERRAVGARGKNWLFFGDQRSDHDFLYREELQTMHKDGHLAVLETAFSRDQSEKIYVQDRMRQRAETLWSWLEEGAHLYVCGDAKRMAKDVDAALHQIVETAGHLSKEKAAEYVQQMKTVKRYQRDVY